MLTGAPYAQAYVHAGMVAYDGEKMSKSKGNLVFVSQLRNSDVDPMAIRLTLLRHHYRSDWEWTDDQLWESVDRLSVWRRALAVGAGAPAAPVVDAVLGALADGPRRTDGGGGGRRVGRGHARHGRTGRHPRPGGRRGHALAGGLGAGSAALRSRASTDADGLVAVRSSRSQPSSERRLR